MSSKKIFKKVLVYSEQIYMVETMKNVTTTNEIKSNFTYQTDYNTKTGELTITIFKGETEEKITLSYWEAFLLSEKLSLEFGRK